MCGTTVTTSSTAGQEFSMSSVESTMSYSVSKTGYYTETGTITGPNRSVTVTLSEIVTTTETVRLSTFNVQVFNRTSNVAKVSLVDITISGGTGHWMWYATGQPTNIPANGSSTFTVPVTGQSQIQITTNSIVPFEITLSGENLGTSGTFECYEFDATSPSSGGSLSGSGGSMIGGSTDLDRIQRVASRHTYPAGSSAIQVIMQ
jgi:hypothetical protein